ncbi:MAG: hypothetical protein ACREUN_17060 [Burkholderiales bacterium]
MKRSIIAIALAVIAAPALALEVGPPFEQVQLDRRLPNIQSGQSTQYADAAAAGATRSESPWAGDFHFIAPPQ